MTNLPSPGGTAPERDLAQAYAYLAASIDPVHATESVALVAAAGRILAQAPAARLDLPAYDVAAMDGYAVRSAELLPGPNRLRVAGRVLAGQVFDAATGPGTCVRIMTGAAMPAGSDAVVMMELVDTDASGNSRAPGADLVTVPGPVAAGLNLRLRAEHVRAGEAPLAVGRRLGPADLALAAAMGHDRLSLYARLRVGILSTGDELRDPPGTLPPGCAYDSNRPMLLAAVASAAMHVEDMGICPDDAQALAQLVDTALERGLDAVLISGGAARGDADAVGRLDGVEFVAVNIRPGRGIAVARRARAGRRLLVLGLPGNAVAAYVLLHMLALPLLARLAGSTAGLPQPIPVTLGQDLRTRAGRIDFRRVRIIDDGAGARVAIPLPGQGSAMIRSVGAADALLAAGPAAQYRAGDTLPAYPISMLERWQ